MINYSVFICVSCVICSGAKLLMPSGNMSKTMNKVIGVLAIFLFVFPFKQRFGEFKSSIKKFSKPNDSLSSNSLSDNVQIQASTLASENIKSAIESKLKDINVIPKKIQIFMDTPRDSCIVMIRCKIFIDSKYSSVKSKIQSEISREFNIPTEIVDQ